MKKTFFLLASLLLLFSLAISVEATEKKAGLGTPPTDLHDLTIFFANDVRGELEPCG